MARSKPDRGLPVCGCLVLPFLALGWLFVLPFVVLFGTVKPPGKR